MDAVEEKQDLIDLARAEDFTDEDFIDCFTETDRERDIINKLKGSGAHLLEGPRGVGKSSLLKKAELELDEEFAQNKTVGVYVNFKASLLVESGSTNLGFDPFLCWVAAKVLDAFYKKCKKLQFIKSEEIGERYKRLLSLKPGWKASELEQNISDLQSLAIAANDKTRQEITDRLSGAGLERFANIEAITDFIKSIVADANLNRINFLFDEAAHTFDEIQQETFFQFFKLLHGGSLAVKAATYPGITSYGKNFEIGQDAIKISISSTDENTELSRSQLRGYFRELVSKRLPNETLKNVMSRGEALDLLILLSHGNPRVFLQTVSKWLASKEYSKRSALAASNDYVASELTSYHLGLKKRLPRFASHIELGMALIKGHVVPELQKKNEGKGADPKIQTVYFTIEATTPHKVKKALTLLEYSGQVFSKSVVKTANRRQSPRYALNLGVAANEKVFHSSFSRNPDLAIKRLSLTDYREFYSTDERFVQLVNEHPSTERCPEGHLRTTDGAFCPECGKKFVIDPVIEDLLQDSIDKLALSDFLKNKFKDDLSAPTIRSAIALTETDIQRAHLIGPFRSKVMINATEEYISG